MFFGARLSALLVAVNSVEQVRDETKIGKNANQPKQTPLGQYLFFSYLCSRVNDPVPLGSSLHFSLFAGKSDFRRLTYVSKCQCKFVW
jgi:hypothetical protein